MSAQVKAAEPKSYPWVLLFLAGLVIFLIAALGYNETDLLLTEVIDFIFICFFVRHLIFAVSAMKIAPTDIEISPSVYDYSPPISVIVPCKNEEAVVDKAVPRLLALNYPKGKLQILVVDDGSDDSTPALLDAWAERYEQIHILHRAPGKGGGKSGALNDALELTTGEIIVIFDADHQPFSDVLWRIARHFRDPNVSAVQGRCRIINANDSPLARLIAIDYLSGYLVNEYGRQSVFGLPAYGGANCAVRKTSLLALGGWNINTVTEDTDLTLRLITSGKRVRFDVTAVDEEEAATNLSTFWRQRYRWSRGHQQVTRDFRYRTYRTKRLTFWEKVETFMFLFVYHVPVFSALGIILLIPWLAGLTHSADPFNFFLLWTLLFLGPLMELGSGLLIGRTPRTWIFSLFLFLPIFLVSVMLGTKAWVDGVLGRPYTWVKTSRASDKTVPDAELSEDAKSPEAGRDGEATTAPERTS